jgi:hypothetical protein
MFLGPRAVLAHSAVLSELLRIAACHFDHFWRNVE